MHLVCYKIHNEVSYVVITYNSVRLSQCLCYLCVYLHSNIPDNFDTLLEGKKEGLKNGKKLRWDSSFHSAN